jgi:hypothetical protein
MTRLKTNYHLVLTVQRDGKPITSLDLNKPRDVFLAKVLDKLKFSLRETAPNMLEVAENPITHHTRSFSTKTQLFIDLHYQLDRLLLIELDYTEERVIKGLSMNLLDKDMEEMVSLVVDF